MPSTDHKIMFQLIIDKALNHTNVWSNVRKVLFSCSSESFSFSLLCCGSSPFGLFALLIGPAFSNRAYTTTQAHLGRRCKISFVVKFDWILVRHRVKHGDESIRHNQMGTCSCSLLFNRKGLFTAIIIDLVSRQILDS